MGFEEKQHLKLWWLYLILGVEVFATSTILFLDKNGLSFADLKRMYFTPILAIFSPFLIIYLLQKSTFTLRINEDGIFYRYVPFHFKFKKLDWKEVKEVYTINYDALGDYGGWGVRYRLWFKFKDKAYLFNEQSKGLQVILNNDEKLLFSSNRMEELELFLINLKTKQNITAIK